VFLIANLFFYFLGTSRGIDFTDEGLYLFSASEARNGISFHSTFGSITGLIYQIVSGNIFLFRLTSVVILLLASALFSRALLTQIGENLSAPKAKAFLCISSLSITTSYYGLGLFSPSYNWVNLVGLLLAAGALLGIGRKKTHIDYFDINLLACGVLISGYSKPTSAFFILILFLMLLGANLLKVEDKSKLLKTFFLFSFIQTAGILFITGGAAELFHKVFRGYHALLYFNPNYSLQSSSVQALSTFVHSFKTIHYLPVYLLLVTYGLIKIQSLNKNGMIKRKSRIYLLKLVIPFILFEITYSIIKQLWRSDSLHYANLFSAASGVLYSGLIALSIFATSKKRDFSPLINVLLCSLLVLVAYSFGSGNGFMNQMTGASGVLVVLSQLIFFYFLPAKNITRHILSLGLLVGIVLVAQSSLTSPYRMPNLLKQDVNFNLGNGHGSLKLDRVRVLEIQKFQKILIDANFAKQTIILDFTGMQTSYVFLADASPPTTILLNVPGYPGATTMAEWSIKQDVLAGRKKELGKAWLLMPLPSVRYSDKAPKVSPIILKAIGKSYPEDYRYVGSVNNFSIWQPLSN